MLEPVPGVVATLFVVWAGAIRIGAKCSVLLLPLRSACVSFRIYDLAQEYSAHRPRRFSIRIRTCSLALYSGGKKCVTMSMSWFRYKDPLDDCSSGNPVVFQLKILIMSVDEAV